jgi:hypothetical protein
MRLPWVRLTPKQIVALVVFAGLLVSPVAGELTRRVCYSLAAYHRSQTVGSIACSWSGPCVYRNRGGQLMMTSEIRASSRHEALAKKYREAAECPWLPSLTGPARPYWIR